MNYKECLDSIFMLCYNKNIEKEVTNTHTIPPTRAQEDKKMSNEISITLSSDELEFVITALAINYERTKTSYHNMEKSISDLSDCGFYQESHYGKSGEENLANDLKAQELEMNYLYNLEAIGRKLEKIYCEKDYDSRKYLMFPR